MNTYDIYKRERTIVLNIAINESSDLDLPDLALELSQHNEVFIVKRE